MPSPTTAARDWLIDRLRKAKAARVKNLRLPLIGRERILVDIDEHSYLISIPQSTAELTPGRIVKRIQRWKKLRQRTIDGHLLLGEHNDLSAQVITEDGENLPPHVAVVGKWGTVNRLVSSAIDANMAYLLELCGVSRADIRRSSQRDEKSTPASSNHKIDRQARYPSKGMRLDAYELEHRLGRGHSAEVWRARVINEIAGIELARGSTVAIKVYLPSLLDAFQPLRIQREFSVASDLRHPNLARVYDLLLSPSRPFNTFMVMEYIDGPTLKSFIEQRGGLTAKETTAIAKQLFSALRELHLAGAIHRDVKAANIMLSKASELTIKLVDLGIVSIASEDKFTQVSVFLGSKHSAPLEQLTGEELNEQTDIYGAGSVLYNCIKGIPLYNEAGPEGAIVRRMLSTPEKLPVNTAAPYTPEHALYQFVNRCISVSPKDRPSTVDDCLETLDKIERTLAIS